MNVDPPGVAARWSLFVGEIGNAARQRLIAG
jgi:hypothetical protein